MEHTWSFFALDHWWNNTSTLIDIVTVFGAEPARFTTVFSLLGRTLARLWLKEAPDDLVIIYLVHFDLVKGT